MTYDDFLHFLCAVAVVLEIVFAGLVFMLPDKKKCDKCITWLKKQCEQNSTDSYCKDNCKGFQETGKCFADGECKAKREAEQKPTWSEEDDRMIRRIEQSLFCYKEKVCGCSLYDDVAAEIEWLKELKKQGKRNSADPFLNWLEKQGEQNNIVEQLTAFAQHLNKRGAFRDELCMDFEHEAQSFIESQMEKRKKAKKK